jgi:hypothetical protein
VRKEESPIAAKVQRGLLKSANGFFARRSRKRWQGRVVDLRECEFGLTSSSGHRYCALHDRDRYPVGDAIYDDSAPPFFPRRQAAIFDGYLAVLLLDGQTFEIFERHDDAGVLHAFVSGEKMCQLVELPPPLPEGSGFRHWVKKTFLGSERWDVTCDAKRLGIVQFTYPLGGKKRIIEFTAETGVLPVRVAGPRYGEGLYDTVIPQGSPEVNDPRLLKIHFLLNLAFRMYVVSLEFSGS